MTYVTAFFWVLMIFGFVLHRKSQTNRVVGQDYETRARDSEFPLTGIGAESSCRPGEFEKDEPIPENDDEEEEPLEPLELKLIP